MLVRPRVGRPFVPGQAYATFYASMVDQLRAEIVPDLEGEATRPLATLQLGSTDDLVAGLIGAWAAVGEVLSFYQDRIATEGYLATAVEERSLIELARSIGYQPRPPLSAQTPLAFRVGSVPGVDALTAPAGTRVQSLPGPSKRSQVFETIESVEVRSEWNELAVALPAPTPVALPEGATELFLGVVTPAVRVGDHLLLRDVDERSGFVRTVSAVEPQPGPPGTRISWATPLPTGLQQPRAHVLRVQARLFGWDVPSWSSLTAAQKRRQAALVGGLAASSDAGATWTGAPGGGASSEVRALVFDAQSNVFAATANEGVLRSGDGGLTWEPASSGLTRRDAHSLALDAEGNLFAGTSSGGVFRSGDSGASWDPFQTHTRVTLGTQGVGLATSRLPNTVVRALGLYVDPRTSATTLLAGTDQGVYRTISGGDGWEAANVGLPNDVAGADATGTLVNTLAFHRPSDHVYAGTRRGVFSSTGSGNRWSTANAGLPSGTTVSSLVTFAAPGGNWTMLAATSAGLFRTGLPSITWTPVSDIRRGTTWRQLAVAADNSGQVLVFAATSSGVLRSRDAGATFEPVTAGLSSVDVRAIAAGPGAHVCAAAPLVPPELGEWPHFAVDGPELDLERMYPQLKTASPLVLLAGAADPPAQVTVYSVASVQRVRAEAFGQRTVVSRVAVDAGLPSAVNRREAVVLAGGEPLALAEARVEPTVTGDTLLLMNPPSSLLPAGRMVIVGGQVAGSGQDGAELRRVRDNSDGRLTLDAPLEETYTAASVRVSANAAPATHGESITEVLGSGDYAQALQQFTLRRGPLTRYATGDTPDPRVALAVLVNGVAWTAVDTLLDHSGREQVYVVQQDADGMVTVRFGDGVNGARLPTGTENVVALYRFGAGPDGELPPCSLVQLLTRPLGLRQVSNPLASAGAEKGDSSQDLRRLAPRALRRIERVVSLPDYASFAREFRGVSRAAVRAIRLAGQSIVHVSVWPPEVDTAALEAAIRAAQPGLHVIQVQVADVRQFVAAADLTLGPAAMSPATIQAAAVAALRQEFGFEHREIGEAATASEVVRILQAVPGVLAVELTQLHFADATAPAALSSVLPARFARVNPTGTGVDPAEVLVLGSSTIGVAPL